MVPSNEGSDDLIIKLKHKINGSVPLLRHEQVLLFFIIGNGKVYHLLVATPLQILGILPYVAAYVIH